MSNATPESVSPSPSSPKTKYFRHFLLLWAGQNFSLLGSEVVGFAITWWITDITKNVLYLSLMMLLTFAPRLLLSTKAGIWADKYNRKLILILADGMQAFTTVILIIVLFFLPAQVWLLIVFNTIRAVFQAIHNPTYMATTPSMVPQDKLSRINGLNQLFQSLIGVAAPVLGALIYTRYGLAQTLWVDIVTFAIALAFMLFITIPPVEEENDGSSTNSESRESFFRSLKNSYHIVRVIPGIFAVIMLIVMVNFLLSPFNTLSTYFINVIHSGDANDMALISVAMQVGMIAGSLVGSLKKEWKHKALVVCCAMVGLFGGIAFFALAPEGNFVWLCISGFAITFILPIAMTINMTFFQTQIPLNKMGRASSFFATLNSAGMLVGYLIAGPLAQWLGAVELILGAGILGITVSIMMFLKTDLRSMDRLLNETEKPEDPNEVESQIETDKKEPSPLKPIQVE